MKIEQSNVSLFSSHYKHDEIQESETLQQWKSEEEAPEEFRGRSDRLVLSEKFKNIKHSTQLQKMEDDINNSSLDPKLMSIVRALEALLGRKIHVSHFDNVKGKEISADSSSIKDAKQETQEPQGPQRVGWGVNYNYQRSEIHEESLKFSAQGSVKTEDGKSIDFSLALSMKNRSEVHESISFKAGDALIDPLVLNFGSDTVSISDVKHEFDLDLDGKSDEFNFVGSGSGFLALDKNSDGKINDGSELFGPTNGNGFNELKAYDSDKNGWIDENDDVFSKLIIWTKDENGEENLYSLKEKDVGALYLNSAYTRFNLNDSANNVQGVMRESSTYLKEDGRVGTLQEVELKI